MSDKLKSNVPEGDIRDAWDNHRFNMKNDDGKNQINNK